MTMTDAELAEIRARADKATPGPWEIEEDAIPYNPKQRSPFADRGASIDAPTQVVIVGGLQDEQGGAVGVLLNEDAAFIAHARTDVPKLCDEVEELRGELARAREVITAYAHADPSLYGDICDCDGGDCARRYLKDASLHSATEDADDRTT